MAAVATYGGFSFDDNEVTLVSVSRTTQYSQRNKRLSQEVTMQCQGEILASTSDAIIARIVAIENALKDDNKEFRFTVNGTLAHSLLLSADCISGVRVVQRAFPRGEQDELATVRTFSFALQATYAAANEDLVSWQETFTTIGTGGPRFYVLETATQPFAVITTNASVVTYQQTGAAVGYSAYPTPPGPSNAGLELGPARRITRGSGRNMGSAIRFYPIQWSYTMFRDPTNFGQADYTPISQ